MTLKVWNAGESINHGDINQNFATHDAAISTNTAAIATNTTGIATNASALSTLSAAAARNPATADLAMASHKITGLAAGSAASDGIRFDQAGWISLGSSVIGTAVSSLALTLPTGWDEFEVRFQGVTAASSQQLFFQVSQDGGTTYINGASAYFYKASGTDGSTTAITTTNSSSVPLTYAATTTQTGVIRLVPAEYGFDFRTKTAGGIYGGGGFYTGTQRMTNILFFAGASANLTAGRFRLLGGNFT